MRFTVSVSAALVMVAATALATPVPEGLHKVHEIARRALGTPADLNKAGSFDYVVLGGGTAGLALAARLSENPFKKVAVLEAGPSGLGNPGIDIPAMFGSTLGGPLDWNYTTTAGDNGVPAAGWPRGKVLGGSSALNFLVWDRASKSEYDAWEELGNKGWNWNTLYAAMKKAEKFTPPTAEEAALYNSVPNPADYGSKGPLQASFPRYVSEATQKWIPALKTLGLRQNDDSNAGDNLGAAVQPASINPKNSTRSYSMNAYIVPVSGRKNLFVVPNSLVSKINFHPALFPGQKRIAKSISYTNGGKQTVNLKLTGEVIVSGGAVGTPQILELSGVGDAKRLSKLGISSVVDLPGVGENLQDHTYTAAEFSLKPGKKTLDSLRFDTAFAAEQQAAYKAGEVSILDEVVPSIGYITLEQLLGADQAAKTVADAEAYVNSAKTPYNATLRKQIEFLKKGASTIGQMELIGIDGAFAASAPPAANTNYVTFLAAQQHLLSRGSIHIQSADVNTHPVINANYYTAPFDLEVATAGTAYLRKIAATPQYSTDFIASEYLPGADADLTQYTKTTFSTEYHPIGTASMLPRNQGGVVDNQLRVYGTGNVRVADASIMPLHISAHIQATVYGIAELAATIIKTGKAPA